MPRPKRDHEKEDLAAWQTLEAWRKDVHEQADEVVVIEELMNTDLPKPSKREAPAD